MNTFAERAVSLTPPHDAAGAFRRDLERYFELESTSGGPGLVERLRIIAGSPGLHAIACYRFGSWVNRSLDRSLARYPFKAVYAVLHQLCIICWGIQIDEHAQIGPGLYIGHFGGVIVGPVEIGEDCNLAHNVTLGGRVDGKPGKPAIGNRVWIGTGSVVFGPVRIGDGVTVGPLTLVSHDVPPRTFVLGNPMRMVQRNYDNTTEIYGANAA